MIFMGAKVSKCNVEICTDYVTNDPDKVKEILERVSRIVTGSYVRVQQEGVS